MGTAARTTVLASSARRRLWRRDEPAAGKCGDRRTQAGSGVAMLGAVLATAFLMVLLVAFAVIGGAAARVAYRLAVGELR